MSLETEHFGYRIAFGENSDLWNCFELHLSEQKLSTLKAKIAKHDTEMRRVTNVSALRVFTAGYGHPMKVQTVSISLVIDGVGCWIKDAAGNREKSEFKHLIVNSPENVAEIEKQLSRIVAADAEKKDAQAIIALLPRVSRDQLKSVEPSA